MTAERIPKSSTIETIWPLLTKPREFGVGVFNRMRAFAKTHDGLMVRIGGTGAGKQPCYRIFHQVDGEESILGSFWDNHEPLSSEFVKTANWCEASMSYGQLESFLVSKFPVKKKA